jgi:hypothetical protein
MLFSPPNLALVCLFIKVSRFFLRISRD